MIPVLLRLQHLAHGGLCVAPLRCLGVLSVRVRPRVCVLSGSAGGVAALACVVPHARHFAVVASTSASGGLGADTMSRRARSASSASSSSSSASAAKRKRKASDDDDNNDNTVADEAEGGATQDIVPDIDDAIDKSAGGEDEDDEGGKPSAPKRSSSLSKNKLNALRELALSVARCGEKSNKRIGAHISAAGGVQNAVYNAAGIGGSAFACDLKSKRQWASNPMTQDTITAFGQLMKEFKFDHGLVLPHGSYLMNLGSNDKEHLRKSRECFMDELQRCAQLGIRLYNFHPGSASNGGTRDNSVKLIAESINLAHADKRSGDVTIVLENTAGGGSSIGGPFEDLRDIIALVHDKKRVGVCIDTCHLYAYGYDFTTADKFAKVFEQFDQMVGFKYLRAIHLNDSKGAFKSRVDRHENLGKGHLGLEPFRLLMQDARFDGIPIILETPIKQCDGDKEAERKLYHKEVQLLYSLESVKTPFPPSQLAAAANKGSIAQFLSSSSSAASSSKSKAKHKEDGDDSCDDGDDGDESDDGQAKKKARGGKGGASAAKRTKATR